MVLCNAPRDASAFPAQPRLCSGFVMLEGFSSIASPGHARMHIGDCSPDSNRRVSLLRLLLEGFSSLDAAPAAIGHGLALTAAEFRVLAFVSLVELHPCQQAESHLACTRPPDSMLIGRPLRPPSLGRNQHAARAFVTTRAGTDTMARRCLDTEDEITEADDTAGDATFSGASLRGTRQPAKKAFVAYWVAEAERRGNMAVDDQPANSARSSQQAASGGAGTVRAAPGQPPPPHPPTLVTSRGHHHRVRGPPQRFKPTDLTIVRVQHQIHFENVACDVMCEHSCTLPECMNRVRTNLVRVAPSKLIHGEAGLFACEDIEEGTVVACFGAVRQLREGEEGTRTRLGYSFIVKEREGKSLTITPKHGVTEGCMAHAINHTCHPGFANCRFVHAGIVGGWSEDEQGGIGGRRTSEVFVKTTKRVESDTELFANYGTKFRFAGGCVCHLCRPFEA
jgi:hypothetical protein